MTVRRITLLLTGVAAASSGLYMIIYLFRWQWNRALIAAIFFVAAEVALVAQVLLERLTQLERALHAAPPPGDHPSGMLLEADLDRVRAQLRAAQPRPSRHFAWLQDSASRHNVFLPVLLGAGVIMSGIAWLVESVARRVAQPALDRPAVAALGRLSFPSGGLLGTGGPAPARKKRFKKWMLVPGALVVIIGMGYMIDAVADATQTRPDEISEDVITVIDVRLAGMRALTSPEVHAQDLYRTCASGNFADSLPDALVVPLNDTDIRYVVHADMGDRGKIRFEGCIEDVPIQEVQATVLSIKELPVNEGDDDEPDAIVDLS
jgi:hypothetical protein